MLDVMDIDSDEEEHECEQQYMGTVKENRNLERTFDLYENAGLFLKRKEHVFARSVPLSSVEQSAYINILTDIDGCVIELKSLNCIDMPIRHLTLCPKEMSSLVQVKSVLKKHLDLTKYSESQRANFTNSMGFQLFYEQGWECCIALIPSTGEVAVQLDKEKIRRESLECFQRLKGSLQKKLLACALDRIALRTLMKNDLNDISKMFVLPDDSKAILNAVQDSVDCSLNPAGFRLILFCFRFGEKMTQGLSLDGFNEEHIESVTVHVGADISSVYNIDLLWSMSGLQSLVGERGVLSTCLSFTDCGNFQSNLDGRAIDVNPQLRRLCKHPEFVRFIQLYADVPHRKPATRFHPVSGCIAGGPAFQKQTADAFCRDAKRYLSTLHSNWILMNGSTCRMEFVLELPSVPGSRKVNPSDCISLPLLGQLLESKPLVVPFSRSTMVCIQQLGLWITNELEKVFTEYKNTGNVSAIWQAYQLELAEEKLLWGRPFCSRSSQFSVNLGPGVLSASRSLTDQLGFLALEESTACLVTDESIPPVSLWTDSEVMKRRILKTIGLHDHLNSSFCVIGRRLIYVLLQDLYDVAKVGGLASFEDFFLGLKKDSTTVEIVGSITLKQLLGLLSTRRRIAFPMVFDRLVEMVEKTGVPLNTVIEEGLKELNIKYFPAVQTYDNSRNAVLKWSSQMKYWRILGLDGSEGESSSSPEVLSSLVRSELERRNLIFISKLKKSATILPWIHHCIRKLSREKLSEDQTIITLTFLSCIAFMMQGWFVDYDRLEKLVRQLPLTQYRMKDLEIQSKMLVSVTFNKFKLFRLHHSIPHQLKIAEPERRKMESKEVEEHTQAITEKRNLIDDDDDVDDVQDVLFREPTCHSAITMRSRWNPQEIEILHEMYSMYEKKSMKEIYDIFKKKCIENNLPFRTYVAFKLKFIRLNPKKGQ